MNRLGWAAIAAALLVLEGTATAGAADAKKLGGWGSFKFDMPYADVQKAIGAKASVFPNGNFSFPVDIDGWQFDAVLFFNRKGGLLRSIELRRTGIDTLAKEACVQHSGAIASAVAKRHGPFASDSDTLARLIRKQERRQSTEFADGLLTVFSAHAVDDTARESCTISIVYEAGSKPAKSTF